MMITQRMASYLAFAAALALCLGQTCTPPAQDNNANETLSASEGGQPLVSVNNPANQTTQDETTEADPQQSELVCNANGPYTAVCEPDFVSIQLDATGSTPSEGGTLTYEWSNDCSGAAFDDNTLPSPELTIDTSVTCPAECTVTLTVDDGILDPVSCDASVSILSRLQCDAGGPYEVECQGATTDVPLDATGSTTVEENATLEYEWSSDCPGATFDDNTSATPILTLDSSQGCTTACTATVTVSDGINDPQTCTADVTVADNTGPVLDGVPEDLMLECDQAIPDNVAEVTATDDCDTSDIVVDFNETEEGDSCERIVTRTWSATDACNNSSSLSQKITLKDSTPPVIELNGDAEITLECSVDEYVEMGAVVTDNCSEPTDATVGGDVVDTTSPGTYVVTYDGEDACGNAAEQVTRTVHVVDTAPPEVTVGDMGMLWPPNHKYAALDLSACNVMVVDTCAGEVDLSEVATIVRIYSDEPENGKGDGNTTEDIMLDGEGRFRLRAERAGGGNGRVYGITFQIANPSGDPIEDTCYIGIPHDQSGASPIDDGPDAGYTVMAEE